LSFQITKVQCKDVIGAMKQELQFTHIAALRLNTYNLTKSENAWAEPLCLLLWEKPKNAILSEGSVAVPNLVLRHPVALTRDSEL